MRLGQLSPSTGLGQVPLLSRLASPISLIFENRRRHSQKDNGVGCLGMAIFRPFQKTLITAEAHALT